MAVQAAIPVHSEPDPPEAAIGDQDTRDRIHQAIATEVQRIVGSEHIPFAYKSLGKELLESLTEILFRVVAKEGYFRFPNGYGSLKVQPLKQDTAPKRLPTGQIIELPRNRVKLRYEEGAAVREMLGMPPKTVFKRKYTRQSALGKRTVEILTEESV